MSIKRRAEAEWGAGDVSPRPPLVAFCLYGSIRIVDELCRRLPTPMGNEMNSKWNRMAENIQIKTIFDGAAIECARQRTFSQCVYLSSFEFNQFVLNKQKCFRISQALRPPTNRRSDWRCSERRHSPRRWSFRCGAQSMRFDGTTKQNDAERSNAPRPC